MLQNTEYAVLQGNLDVEVTDIAYHSAKVKAGTAFVCMTGENLDGHTFAKEAVDKGSAVVVCSKPLSFKEQVTVIQVPDSRKALAEMAAAYYGYPGKQLHLIGVTGTKGKTTITYMLQNMFSHAGVLCGRIGTVENDTKRNVYASKQTTPESLEIQRLLREMADAGCKAAVLEISSQAMMQKRAHGLQFDVGILTGISEDHIGKGEHQNFHEYVYWKSQMLHQCRSAVINFDVVDMPQIRKVLEKKPFITFGFQSDADLWVKKYESIRLSNKLGVEFQTKGRYNIKLVTAAPGAFSVANSLAAIAAAKKAGIADSAIQNALRTFAVPGRQELFAIDYQRTVLVDYAHNGAALEALLKALREYHPRKLTCVFGCGGGRNPARRWTMGEAAAKYADLSIITADNPRKESLDSIFRDIIKGLEAFSGNYVLIENREDAIVYALQNCEPGELVVIAGKGHECVQLLHEEEIHFDDREIVRTFIEKVKYEQDYNRRNQAGMLRTVAFRR